mmetsp:Transcript_46477/g.124233  ORF Transcript_46477/g.124233 Transcript_46477/m.124233 type:complete len:436 (+) Transcript_46477:575-1882(+)
MRRPPTPRARWSCGHIWAQPPASPVRSSLRRAGRRPRPATPRPPRPPTRRPPRRPCRATARRGPKTRCCGAPAAPRQQTARRCRPRRPKTECWPSSRHPAKRAADEGAAGAAPRAQQLSPGASATCAAHHPAPPARAASCPAGHAISSRRTSTPSPGGSGRCRPGQPRRISPRPTASPVAARVSASARARPERVAAAVAAAVAAVAAAAAAALAAAGAACPHAPGAAASPAPLARVWTLAPASAVAHPAGAVAGPGAVAAAATASAAAGAAAELQSLWPIGSHAPLPAVPSESPAATPTCAPRPRVQRLLHCQTPARSVARWSQMLVTCAKSQELQLHGAHARHHRRTAAGEWMPPAAKRQTAVELPLAICLGHRRHAAESSGPTGGSLRAALQPSAGLWRELGPAPGNELGHPLGPAPARQLAAESAPSSRSSR